MDLSEGEKKDILFMSPHIFLEETGRIETRKFLLQLTNKQRNKHVVIRNVTGNCVRTRNIRRPFAKFMDSHYYSESVSLSKYLPR
jgi:hypothetical protein